MAQRKQEYVTGQGYYWSDTWKRVQQEEELIPGTVLPIGHTDYGKPWAFRASELHIESCSDGLWVMDRLGSYHRHPFKTETAAQAYLKHLQDAK
jgi:hypothetical protein